MGQVRVVVIGDLGSPTYHVGDEAMSLQAVDMLRARGISDIVVVADDPDLGRERYGCDAVPRIGFPGAVGPRGRERLEEVTASLSSGRRVPDAMAAVVDADALVIAGGGNVSSQHPHHLYERLALSRAARHAGRPVLISSQTVGPLVLRDDRPYFSELLATATAVGVRERDSHKLASRVGVAEDRLTLTVDDAAWLEPGDDDRARVDALGLPVRIVTMSLTYHTGAASYPQAAYIARAAASADALADRLDATVVLVPHFGLLAEGSPAVKDVETNEAVAAASSSGRVRALPMADARTVVEIARRSLLVVTTRYHPTVFGPSNRVPAIAVSTSYYSSLRMRGSLAHVGLSHLVLPAEIWTPELVLDAVEEIEQRRDDIDRLFDRALPTSRGHSVHWWDAIVGCLHDSGRWTPVADVPWVPRLKEPSPLPEWRARSREALRISDGLTKGATQRLWVEKAARAAAEHELAQLRRNPLRARRHRG